MFDYGAVHIKYEDFFFRTFDQIYGPEPWIIACKPFLIGWSIGDLSLAMIASKASTLN
jgi:hypothetical protein